MKQYIGHLAVLAMVMTRKEYNDYRGWELPESEQANAGDEGYLIEYPELESNHEDHEGYITWLPKEQFEEVYKPAETPLDRVIIERDELVEKMEALKQFIRGERPEDISRTQWRLLSQQHYDMEYYLRTLEDRIEIMQEEAEEAKSDK